MQLITLAPLDWAIIVGYIVVAFAIGLWFSKRASKNIDEYFVAGRNLSWWVAGTSIVATTFAADTPLAISGWVRTEGIHANWIWWADAMAGMLCVFFFASLWRRARVVTDAEFIELRYSGKPAAGLRVFHAVYAGVIANCITMGWVMLAMSKITGAVLGWDKVFSIAVLCAFALGYTVLSGFWGVVMTDLVQFAMAMLGSIILAIVVMVEVGGPAELASKIRALGHETKLDIININGTETFLGMPLGVLTFLLLLSAMWWAGGQGSGFLAQRLFATRNERHAMGAALWYNFAHLVLRPWPWIVVGLASLILLQNTADLTPVGAAAPDHELAYPVMMGRYLPVGLLGLMVASFLAAFMSTIDTHLNWGASYLVNDIYRRFVRPGREPRHYVAVARWASVLLICLAGLVAFNMEAIKDGWIYIKVLAAGLGLVTLLRWYWWRVNAWAEIAALTSTLIVANGIHIAEPLYAVGLIGDAAMADVRWFYGPTAYAVLGVSSVAVTTVVWIVVMLLTKPTPVAHLEKFYRRVQPGGWWGPVKKLCPDVEPRLSAGYRWFGWFAGICMIYSGLFGVGFLCLGEWLPGVVLLGLCAAMCVLLLRNASLFARA